MIPLAARNVSDKGKKQRKRKKNKATSNENGHLKYYIHVAPLASVTPRLKVDGHK